VPKPPLSRVAIELVVVLVGLFAVMRFVPLDSRWFVAVTALACVLATSYAVYGALRMPGAAKWWGFLWGGRYADDLALGVWNTGLLFVASLIPVAAVKCVGIRTPSVLHPVAYLFWCVIQDFLFYSLILRGIERLTNGYLIGHTHLAVWLTAALFGLSHYPMLGFMALTGLIGVFWGYLFLRTHLLWPITGCHFLLGLLIMS
jgi:membrane protease YdiL (CAAX protease family)